MENDNKSIKILLVEDDPTTLEKLGEEFRKEGLEVFQTNSGADALAIAVKEDVDILVIDYNLPKVNGVEVTRKIKELLPNVKPIFTTGFGDADLAIACLNAGAFDYLKKPFDRQEVFLALGRAKEKIYEERELESPITIMCVEDEDMARRYLVEALEDEGHHVIDACNGEEGCKLFAKHKVDVMILDLKMPKKDGPTTLKELRAKSDDFEAIILTGYGDEDAATTAMRNGALSFLKKPVDLDQLFVTIDKAIEKIQMTRSLKYSMREAEINRKILTYISEDKEIHITLNEETKARLAMLADNFLERININMAIINANKEILHGGKGKLDEQFLDNFLPDTLKGQINLEEIDEKLQTLFDSDSKDESSKSDPIQIITKGEKRLLFMRLSVRQDKQEEAMVLLTIG